MNLRDIDAVELYHSWLYNTGCFECFVRTGPFTSLKHYRDFELTEPCTGITDSVKEDVLEIVKRYDLKSTLFVLDMPDSVCLTAGAFLNNEACIKPILVLNFLLHDFGLVGSRDFVNALVGCGLALKKAAPEGYAIILDYNRFLDFTPEELLKGFNNQYEITDEDVPDVPMLKVLGYETLVYISMGEVKEDMKYYLEYLEQESIGVAKFNIKRDS
ncbi:MAG: hypothetical protein Q8930_11430 [Bacillota bacterium]|nr:hypothetical protein [Bacillota bacterium]